MAGEKTTKKFVTLQEIYDGYAKKAKESGKDHEVDIVKRYPVLFTENFQGHKIGGRESVSKVMYDWYNANGVIKLIKDEPAAETAE